MIKQDPDTATPVKQGFKVEIGTPATAQHDHDLSHCDQIIINDLRSLLSIGKYQQALDLIPSYSFLRELVCDHIEISKMQEILFPSAQTIRIHFKSQMFSLEREARLKTILTLRGNRGINNILTNQISDCLQDILFDKFEPLKSFSSSPSNVFVQLYQKLNKIQQKIDLLKGNSDELPMFLKKNLSEVVECNRNLKERLNHSESKISRFQHEAENAVHQSTILKKQIESLHIRYQQFQRQKLAQQNLLNEYMKSKDDQYIREIQELRNGKNHKVSQFKDYLNYSINDLQNLIQRLSQQNKILKEEKELLLAKLSRIYEKFSVFTNLFNSKVEEKRQQNPIQASEPQKLEPLIDQRKQIIKGLKQKLRDFQGEMAEKNQTIYKINDQLQQLRRQKLNHSIIQGSFSSSSNEEIIKSKKYKRVRADQQAISKILELEQLRKKDKDTIDELCSTIEQLTFKIGKETASKINQSQNTLQSQKQAKSQLNFSKVLEHQENEQLGRNLEIMTDKIKILEASLEEERKTNASLNVILDDFHSLEKKMEESQVLISRKNQANDIIKKCQKLEQQLVKLQAEKQQLIQRHKEELLDMELKNGEHELSLVTMGSKIEQLQYQLSKKEKQLKSKKVDQSKQQKVSMIQIEQFKAEKKRLEIELEQKNIEIVHLDSQIMQLKQQLDSVSSRLKSAQTTLQYTRQRALTAEKKYKSLSVAHQFHLANPTEHQSPLFYGDILEDRPFEKQFLVNTLQARVKRSLRRTRMLWKFDPLNKTNFHQYIDNRDNLVILIQLEADFVIGCYSEGKMHPKMVSDKDGLIFSLTRKQIFEPIEPNRRVVTYDDYYLIFGNSEVRIRSQEAKLFSNFALTSGYFKSRGIKFDVLTNSNEREVALKSWEVHQFEVL